MKRYYITSYIIIGLSIFGGITTAITRNAHASLEGLILSLLLFIAPVVSSVMIAILLLKFRFAKASRRALLLVALAGIAPWITLALLLSFL